MQLQYEPIRLDLRVPFRIAHGTSHSRENVLLRLSDGEHEGYGEAAPVRQHHETQAEVLDYLAALSLPDDPFLIEDILSSLPPGPRSAQAAIDIALHDLVGKKLGVPIYRLFGLNPNRAPQTSFTIGIGTPDEVQQQALAVAQRFPILKIKLGHDTAASIEQMRAIRAVSDARLVADANCAWSLEQALEIIPRLADLGLEWIEQPLPEDDLDGMRRLRWASPLPIFADEPVRAARDIPRLVGCADGVSIKLMKAGGLRHAYQAIAVARAHDLQVLLSCMVETSLGITAAAHLAPLADWADLDGNLWLVDDPFLGVRVQEGRLLLPDGPGLGITRRAR